MIPPDDELFVEAPDIERRRPVMVLITLLLVLAMLATLIWPLLRSGPRRQLPPTPTPVHFRAA